MTTSAIINLIYTYAAMYNVDPQIALAVAKIESGLNETKIGDIGEIGLFQVRPEYTWYSKKALQNPYINTMVGIQRIKEEQELCHFKDPIHSLICYNYGRTNAKRVRFPHRFPYVLKINKELK